MVTRPANIISDPAKERHRLYSLLAMACTLFFWNGFKKGKAGTYPMNEPVADKSPKYLKGDYYGHNIVALAVDFDGRVVDFEINHNNLFNSSNEHAESRLVKRIYSLASLADTWNFDTVPKNKDDYNTFSDVTIYTTLESCSQCSGIMALAQVKEIAYLQADDGMYLIGNILRNLTEGTKLQAPNPVDASAYDFEYYDLLNNAFDTFSSTVSSANPFFIPSNTALPPDASQSVTSFLCTKIARDIYQNAKNEFDEYLSGVKPLVHPDFRPNKDVIQLDGTISTMYAELKNADLLKEFTNFYSYIETNARRATPHKI